MAKRKKRYMTVEELDWMVKAYHNGMSSLKIAAKLCVSKQAICQSLDSLNVKLRKRGRYKNGVHRKTV